MVGVGVGEIELEEGIVEFIDVLEIIAVLVVEVTGVRVWVM